MQLMGREPIVVPFSHGEATRRTYRPGISLSLMTAFLVWAMLCPGCESQQETVVTATEPAQVVPQREAGVAEEAGVGQPAAANDRGTTRQIQAGAPEAAERNAPLPEVQALTEMADSRSSRWLAQTADPDSGERLTDQAPVTPAAPEPPAPQPQPAEQEEPLVAPVPEGLNMPLLRPGMADELVSVNFDNVDIRTVLKTIGEITGINFIPHQSVGGNVTVMSPTPIRLGDIYAFLQSILDVHGYATVEAGNAVKVVPKAEAARHHVQVRIGADPQYIPKTDMVVTQIIPLQYADVAEMSQIIQPILSSGSQMATYPRTNSLMITDTSANIYHIVQVIRQLDVEGSRERVMLFPLTHASAQILSEQVVQILQSNGAAVGVRGPNAKVVGSGPRILPDNRTNSLIAIASEQDIARVAEIVEQLDIRRPVGMDNVHVVYLKNADANEVALSLEQAMTSMRLTGTIDGGQQVQVTPDPSTNALVISASPPDFEVLSRIIEKLDIVREQVLVEMLIVEITEESLLEIGIDWATLDEAVADSVRGFGVTNFGPRVDFLSGRSEGLNIGAWQAAGDGVNIAAILHALERESGVNILSTPHILTSNHRRARIVVGENRPFVTESRITESTDPINPTVIKSFEYKDVGITLEIVPHVSQGGLIRLEIDSEFTKLIEDVSTQSLDTPATAKRTAQTVVTMGSGATVVIGGLIRDDTITSVRKIPLIGDLPLVGGLFQAQRDLSQKTNLLLFITPHVMSTQEDLKNMTEAKRAEMDEASREDR